MFLYFFAFRIKSRKPDSDCLSQSTEPSSFTSVSVSTIASAKPARLRAKSSLPRTNVSANFGAIFFVSSQRLSNVLEVYSGSRFLNFISYGFCSFWNL